MKKFILKVSDITRYECGFHGIACTKEEADAIMGHHKTATCISASCSSIQKGDIIVFSTTNGFSDLRIPHPIDTCVFECSFVSFVPNSSPAMLMVCFHQKAGYAYPQGDVDGEYKEDTIIQEV